MAKARKIEKVLCFALVKAVSNFRPRWGTQIQFFFYRRWGVRFNGRPNYLSSRIWLDGTDYSLIHIGNEVTISSYVRILTHDWALHTVAKAFGIPQPTPLGKILPVRIGDYTFIGTGTILMPGCDIGKACIVAAGTVVRGKVPDFSIYGGSPGRILGDTREYMRRQGIGQEL